ncbi:P-loop containing nucleoside triphosphate hydrolase protein [Scenedesmus sp. NREL 46B-D3]|nr:P-loop containing nucleoside triphosphate hydrolase protein [Scenedesmus sp. NREL 46B-D3]
MLHTMYAPCRSTLVTSTARLAVACRTASTTAAHATAEAVAAAAPCIMQDREYQRELIDLVKGSNALIALPTGSGKTHVAARVIQEQHLPAAAAAAKAGGRPQAIVFLAPTNPLAAQQCAVLKDEYGMEVRAYHGDGSQKDISSWSASSWAAEVAAVDVMVMTPDVLLHILAHGSILMRDISLLVFDEAHHCNSDHPYAQIMEDFYHTLDRQHRPQVLGFTASPKGLENSYDVGASKNSKRMRSKGAGAATVGGGKWGLQHRLDARLVTAADHLRRVA